MPATGTKNFTPPSGTPSYFTDENGKVTGGGAAASPADSDERDEVGPAPATAPATAAAPRPGSARYAASGKRAGKGKSRTLARRRRHGGSSTRFAHARATPTRHVATLRQHQGQGRAKPQLASRTHGRPASHAATKHAATAAHVAKPRAGAAKSKAVHAKPKHPKTHAERVLDRAAPAAI